MDRLRISLREYLDKLSERKAKMNTPIKNLRTDHSVFQEARHVAEKGLAEGSLAMKDVWILLMAESERLTYPSVEIVSRWQSAVEALLPYAIYLYLAPKRPEFKRVKLCSSYYLNRIGGFVGAEAILERMGYVRPWPGATELALGRCKSRTEILDVMAEVVTLHQELDLVGWLVRRAFQEGLVVSLNFVLVAKCRKHLSLEDFWNLVRSHAHGYHNPYPVEPLPPPGDPSFVAYGTPSSVGLTSPGHVHPEDLPAPALTESQMQAMLRRGRSSVDYHIRDRSNAMLALEFHPSDGSDAPESLPNLGSSGSSSEHLVRGSLGKQCSSENNLSMLGTQDADGVASAMYDLNDGPCSFVVVGDIPHQTKLPPSMRPRAPVGGGDDVPPTNRRTFSKSQSIDERGVAPHPPPRVRSSCDFGAQVDSAPDVQPSGSNSCQPAAKRNGFAPDYRPVPSPRRKSPTSQKKATANGGEYAQSGTSRLADVRYSASSSQPWDTWTCKVCGGEMPRLENQCNECGRVAHWVVSSPDSLVISNGDQLFPPVSPASRASSTTSAAGKPDMTSYVHAPPSRWKCPHCQTPNTYINFRCLKCNEPFRISDTARGTASPQKLGGRVIADGSTRRNTMDGPSAQKMRRSPLECPECMYLIPPGAEECPSCKGWTYGSGTAAAKPRRSLNPMSWFPREKR